MTCFFFLGIFFILREWTLAEQISIFLRENCSWQFIPQKRFPSLLLLSNQKITPDLIMPQSRQDSTYFHIPSPAKLQFRSCQFPNHKMRTRLNNLPALKVNGSTWSCQAYLDIFHSPSRSHSSQINRTLDFPGSSSRKKTFF